jgi:type IV secretion system protein VirB6
MAVNLFQTLEHRFEAPIREFIDTGIENVASNINGPLRAALMLYVVLFGYQILSGRSSAPMMEGLFRIMKGGIILMLVTNASNYNLYVTSLFFENLPREIGGWIGGSSTFGGSTFDLLLNSGLQSAQVIWAQAGVTDPAPALLAAIVALAAMIATALGFGIAMFAKIALAVVLALGPIFIALALFKPTQRLTEAWTAQLINYVVLQILTIAVMLLIVTVAKDTVQQFTSGDPFMPAVVNSTIFILAGFIMTQLPGLASSIAGGGAALATDFMSQSAGRVSLAAASFGARMAGGAARSSAGAIGNAGMARSERMWANAARAASNKS